MAGTSNVNTPIRNVLISLANGMKPKFVHTLRPCLLLVTIAGGCSQFSPPPEHSHEDLDATVWMRTSAEYFGAARQAFAIATAQLETAVADPNWTALPEQQAAWNNDPQMSRPQQAAVIIDLDETVLDNSLYQVELIDNSTEFGRDTWNQWVDRTDAGLVPGARDFINTARERGVHIFFVTNRSHENEPATRRALEELEILTDDAPDDILSKGERDSWTSDKTTRRLFVAKRYRVLLLIGDDLNDFVWAGYQPSADVRRNLAWTHANMWGHRWFIIPNANYGGWERACMDLTTHCLAEKKYN